MNWLWNLNLLHLFGFYLALMFLFSVYGRFAQYRAIVHLILTGPGRWPRLLELIWKHGGIFLTWSTFLPALLAFGLTVVHWLLARLAWPTADVTLTRLGEHVWAWPIVAIFCLAMLGVDIYCTFVVSEVDPATIQKYLDEAEYWLRSWTAGVVKVLSLGKINPRQMVASEVDKALQEASRLLNANLWWIVGQIGLRFLLGTSLWLSCLLPSSQ